MRRVMAFAPVLVLAALVVISALVLTRGGEHQTLTGGLLGRPAPTYQLARLGDGAPVTNEAFRGRVYLINVFASWCVPCRAEVGQLAALKARGVPILGVAYKDKAEETTAFLAQLGNPYDVIGQDPDGQFGLQLGTAGVPETFVIGADGRIRAVLREPITANSLARVIEPALAGNS